MSPVTVTPSPVTGTDLWATEHETREEIIGFYRRVSEHSDATITALPIANA